MTTLAEQINNQIERSLRGDATPLRIVECAGRYVVSPSRMHTIFHRLAGVGLVLTLAWKYGIARRSVRRRTRGRLDVRGFERSQHGAAAQLATTTSIDASLPRAVAACAAMRARADL